MAKTTFSFTIERRGVLDTLLEAGARAVEAVCYAASTMEPDPTPLPDPAPRRDPADRVRHMAERRLDAFLDAAFVEFLRFMHSMGQSNPAAQPNPPNPPSSGSYGESAAAPPP